MFTSNGLMCLSGVTMCRMCLSAMVSSRRSRSVFMRYAELSRPRSMISAPRLSPAQIRMSRPRAFGCRRATAASRSASAADGANANPVGPQELWPIPCAPSRASMSSNRADIGAREARSALRRGEIVAEALLHFRDRGPKAGKVLLGEAGSAFIRTRRHRCAAASPRKRRKVFEGRDFVGAVLALPRRIENDQDAPVGRETACGR